MAKADLRACVAARTLQPDHHAVAEFGVPHRLPDLQPVMGGCARRRGNGPWCRRWQGPRWKRLRRSRAPRGQPAHRLGRQFLEEARPDAVAGLPVQQPALRKAEEQVFARARDRHVHQAALLLQAPTLAQAVLMGKEALFQAGDEHRLELQALGRVDRHQLQRVLPLARLVVARFQRCVRQKRGERRNFSRRSALRREGGLVRRSGPRRGGGLAARETLLGDETGRCVDQLLQVLQPLLPLPFTRVVRRQPALLDRRRHKLRKALRRCGHPKRFDQPAKLRQARRCASCQRADHRIQAGLRGSGCVLQLLQRARANAARGEIDRAGERDVVVRIARQPQVGERVLDFGPFEEPQPAVDPVRQRCGE